MLVVDESCLYEVVAATDRAQAIRQRLAADGDHIAPQAGAAQGRRLGRDGDPGRQPAAKAYRVCIGGERACPPEDCGGVWGYEGFLAAVCDPGHEDHERQLEWVGGEFDPDHLDLAAVNQVLAFTRRRAASSV